MNVQYKYAVRTGGMNLKCGVIKIAKSYDEAKKYLPAFLGIIGGNLYFKGGRIATLREAEEKGMLEFKLGKEESLDDYCFIVRATEEISLKNDPFPQGTYRRIRVFYEIVGKEL